MSNAINVPRLIAEVQKRPALWDNRHGDHKARRRIPKLWFEVAQIVGTDVVEQCKRKWKNLRDAYRAEVKRSERRIESDKAMGVYEPSTNYNSKWVYFPLLSFISESNQNCSYSLENENTNSYDDKNHLNDGTYDTDFHVISDIKLERSHDTDENVKLIPDDEDDANDTLFEEFKSIAAMTNNGQNNSTSEQSHSHASAFNANRCQCSRRLDDEVNFLQDLGREEQKLIKSTKREISRCSNLDHIGDSDYNFLVSFLPQMKKMSELQNLQFRAKMCEMLLKISIPTVTEDSQNINIKNPVEYATQKTECDKESKNSNNSSSFNNFKEYF